MRACEIGAALGLTKNAIIGLCYRNDIPLKKLNGWDEAAGGRIGGPIGCARRWGHAE